MGKQLTKNFHSSEFECPCCGQYEMDMHLIGFLQSLREYYGAPIKINSGFRCESHNAAVGGKSTSEHTMGKGVDVHCVSSALRHDILMLAVKAGINRIGIADTFVHLGTSESLPQNVVWVY